MQSSTGGILIMTSLILFLVNVLHLNQTMEATMAMKRFHHQLDPMRIRFESGYDQLDIREFLAAKGHASVTASQLLAGFASVIAISNRDGVVETAIDPRRGGKGRVFEVN
jgi:gamma-glutamyltranspeptidase